MKNTGTRFVLAVLLLVALGALTSALGQMADAAPSASKVSTAVPHLVQFGGVAKDINGKPLTGTVGITFLLYSNEHGGAPLWMETQNVQADAKGHYAVQLGATKSDGLPTDEFASGQARWLGVQIAGQEEQPRVLLLSVPYAFKAADAETIGGLPPSAFVRANPDAAPQSGGRSSTAASPSAASSTASSAASPNTLPPLTLLAVKTNSPGATVGFVPVWTGSKSPTTTIGSSVLFQSGSNVGIGTTSPTATLDVKGSSSVEGTLFATGSNNGTIIQATQNSSTSGAAVAGVSSGSSGVGVEGSGVTGVVGTGLAPANSVGVLGGGNLYGVEGTNSSTSGSSAGVFGNATATSGGAVGVWGQSRSGDGVFGVANATSGTTYGVIGINNNPGNLSAGVQGQSFAVSGKTWGLVGASRSPNGIGAVALGLSESKIGLGLIGCCPVGVWGDTGSNLAGAAGLVGTADDARAIYLQNNSPSGVPTAFMFQGASGQLALVAGGGTGACIVDTNGDLACHGTKSAVVEVENGQRQVALYAVESPQNWFEDFGHAQLATGAITVKLDPTFVQTVNMATDYHVFLTPEGDCRGLYVSNKSPAGFEVHELGGGQSSVAFDYRIVALRRGYENVRLEDKTAMMAKVKAQTPKPSATPGEPVLPAMAPGMALTMPASPSNTAALTSGKLAQTGKNR